MGAADAFPCIARPKLPNANPALGARLAAWHRRPQRWHRQWLPRTPNLKCETFAAQHMIAHFLKPMERIMGCRVGMSATPHKRIDHWKRKEGHRSGRILVSGLTYKQATAREKSEAQKRNCYYKHGGEDNGKRNWSVYHVWGGKVPKK